MPFNAIEFRVTSVASRSPVRPIQYIVALEATSLSGLRRFGSLRWVVKDCVVEFDCAVRELVD